MGEDLLRRFPDWPKRLDQAIEAGRSKPFVWGSHDCVLFAADVVLALTGEDLAAQWRGQYDSAETALRAIHKGGGLITMAADALGEPVPVLSARRGDVVLYRDERGPSLGICLDRKCAFTGVDGLTFKSLKECEQAWHV